MVFPSQHQQTNRLLAVMDHTSRYAFKGQARLAEDAGVSRSAVSRIISGECSPSFAVVAAISRALEQRIGRTLDPRELISFNGTFPTPYVCPLVGCKGCLPAFMFDVDGNRKPEYRFAEPGQWSGISDSLATVGSHEAK